MLPKWPGTDITTMDGLLTFNNQPDHPAVTDELMMAICWEETFFNNVRQDGGTAIGPATVRRSVRLMGTVALFGVLLAWGAWLCRG